MNGVVIKTKGEGLCKKSKPLNPIEAFGTASFMAKYGDYSKIWIETAKGELLICIKESE